GGEPLSQLGSHAVDAALSYIEIRGPSLVVRGVQLPDPLFELFEFGSARTEFTGRSKCIRGAVTGGGEPRQCGDGAFGLADGGYCIRAALRQGFTFVGQVPECLDEPGTS